jgi:hypothetical protein
MSNFTFIRPVGAELFHMDRQTGGRTAMTKLIAAFRNFAKAPKNVTVQVNTSDPKHML